MIEKFVDTKDVDPIYFDSPYYVAPDGAVAEETFRVIQQAMAEKRKVALSRVVLSNRERLIALMCRDEGFLMMTLRTADEVRDAKEYFTDITDEKAEPDMLELAERNEPADLITLSEALRARGDLADVGGTAYLAELAERVPTAANIMHYARIVRDRSVLRGLIAAATEIATGGYEASGDVKQLLDALESRYEGLRGLVRDEAGQVHHHVNLYVNGEEIGALQGAATRLKDGDEVSIIPALAGGA